jgi:acetyl-CoA C-acetyltransferase
MESMTNAPYLLPKARGGYRLGHGQIMDHMFLDGLEDAYEGHARSPDGHLRRRLRDDLRLHPRSSGRVRHRSTTRAKRAIDDGSFAWEIAPVTVAGRKGDVTIASDEGRPRPTSTRSRP